MRSGLAQLLRIQAATVDDEDESPSLPDPAPASHNSAMHARVRAEFVDDLPRRLRSVESAVEKGDWPAAQEGLHQLAGSAGVMGFMPLSIEAHRTLQEIQGQDRLDVDAVLKPIQKLVSDITKNHRNPAGPTKT